jgi:hypothetical protein
MSRSLQNPAKLSYLCDCPQKLGCDIGDRSRGETLSPLWVISRHERAASQCLKGLESGR